jgi:dienelactone hydrolase
MLRIVSGLIASGFAGLFMCVPVADAIQEATADQRFSPQTVEYPSASLSLRGQVFRPAGAGRYPAILFLHGSAQDYTREVAAVGPLYARHEYVLFVPFRRGQGLSVGRGEWIIEPLSREFKANGGAARMRLMAQLLATEQMDDVLAALKYLHPHNQRG